MARLGLLALGILLAGCSPDPATPPGTAATPSAPGADRGDSPSPTRSPSQPPPVLDAGTYLALGDSLAVGVGATRAEQGGYVARLFAELSRPERTGVAAARLVNLAVGGETSRSIIDGGQLARALATIRQSDPPVSVITLDIGGNDLLRLLATEPCASMPDSSGCRALLAATLASFQANFRQVLAELIGARDEHAPGATLVVMTYFNPFSGTDAIYEQAGELALLGSDLAIDCAASTTDLAQRGMNDIITCSAAEAGALAVDIHPRFDELGLELTHIGAEDIHANDRGYEVIADEFLAVLGAGSAADPAFGLQ